jgi:hypothetical protein
LKQEHRDNEAIRSLGPHDHPFGAFQRASFHYNRLAFLQERACPELKAGFQDRSYAGDLLLRDGYWAIRRLKNGEDPGTHQDRKFVSGIEAAKGVARKKWNFDFLNAVRPLAASEIGRQKDVVSFLS